MKKRCILLAVIWNYITMHGHMNVKQNICAYVLQCRTSLPE